MPVTGNRYFNSPELAAAASNLSALFAPPSGSDAAGFAAARAKNEEARRLAEFFDYAKDPNYSRETADRLGIGVGAFSPNQSFYSVDQGNLTTQRGQDVTARTALTTNAADNARALREREMQEATSRANNANTVRGSTISSLYDALAPGEIRPEVPEDIAAIIGLPGVDAVQGAPKPLSETELKAAILGGMSPEMQQAAAFGSTPIDEVLTPEGPKNVLRPDAVGQVPYDKPTGGMSLTVNPDGTTTFTQGSGAALTEAQARSVNFGATAETMLPVLDRLSAELTNLPSSISTNVPVVGNYAQSEEYQKARVVGERFVQSILRNESGAATPDSEVAKYNATLLPQPGDKPGTIRFKSWLRKVAVEALKGGMSLNARKAQIDAAIAAGPPPDFETAAPTAEASAAPPAPDAAAAPTPEKYPEGTVIQNAEGAKMVRRNGAWEPM